jgi:acetolactate decarboxylase
MANSRLAVALDLRALAGQPDLYGIGPVEQLRGEVTIINGHSALATVAPDGRVHVEESFETGVPFFVWSRVPIWRPMPLPAEVRSLEDLERFVPTAALKNGHMPDKPLPFLLSGRADLIEFHILNRTGGGSHDPSMLNEIQIAFATEQTEAVIIGFHAPKHRGVFTPIDSNVHMHFQTADDSQSGHITKLALGSAPTLSLPEASA